MEGFTIANKIEQNFFDRGDSVGMGFAVAAGGLCALLGGAMDCLSDLVDAVENGDELSVRYRLKIAREFLSHREKEAYGDV